MLLSQIISEKITVVLIKNEILEPSKKDIYCYCFDFALDLIMFNLSILLIGALRGFLFPSLVYIMTLVPIRMLAGGAHTRSRYSCFFLSYLIYFIILYLSQIPFQIKPMIYFAIISVIIIFIWLLAPVETENKHFSKSERKRIKKYLLILLLVIYAFAILMLSWKQQIYHKLILICLCTVFINQCIALYKNHRGESNDTEHSNL